MMSWGNGLSESCFGLKYLFALFFFDFVFLILSHPLFHPLSLAFSFSFFLSLFFVFYRFFLQFLSFSGYIFSNFSHIFLKFFSFVPIFFLFYPFLLHSIEFFIQSYVIKQKMLAKIRKPLHFNILLSF